MREITEEKSLKRRNKWANRVQNYWKYMELKEQDKLRINLKKDKDIREKKFWIENSKYNQVMKIFTGFCSTPTGVK
jgi:hypothetical protein